MTDDKLDIALDTPEVTWGHKQREVDDSQRWKSPRFDKTIEVAGCETVPYGQAAEVVNVGSPLRPRLRFYIPQGAPGAPAQFPGGTSGNVGGIRVENGLVTGMDGSVRPVRSTGFEGEQINGTFTLTSEGALTLKLSMKEELASLNASLENNYGDRITKLEAFGSAEKIKELQQEHHDRWVKESARNADLMTMVVQLQNSLNNVQTLLLTMHPELADRVKLVQPITLVQLADKMKEE